MAEASSYGMTSSGKKAAPFPLADDPFNSNVWSIDYLIITLSWPISFGWCKRILIKGDSFLVHQKSWPQSVNLHSLFIKFWSLCLFFLIWNGLGTHPRFHLFGSFSHSDLRKAMGFSCMHISVVCLERASLDFGSAYSGGLPHVYFLTIFDDWFTVPRRCCTQGLLRLLVLCCLSLFMCAVLV